MSDRTLFCRLGPAALAGAALASVLVAASSSAEARPRNDYTTDKAFGLGIMLGAPTGLAGKYFLGDSPTALQFGVGTYYEVYDHDGTHLHVDVLWHPVVLATTRSFALPLYFGVGGRIMDHGDYYHQGHFHDDDTHLGVRVPVGIAFDFTRAPLDLFIELVPVWDFVHDDDDFDGHHHDRFDLTGAVGLRYYF